MSADLEGCDLTTASALRELLSQLSSPRRRAFLTMLPLMLAGASAEVIAIGALLPFLAIVADPQGSPLLIHARPLLGALGVSDPDHIAYALTALFALAVLFAAGLRLLLLWATNRFIYGVSYELGVRLYSDTLYEPYTFHTRRNSSEIIATLDKVQLVTNGVLMPLMQAVIALTIAVFIVAGLLAIDPAVALTTGIGFSAIYFVVSLVVRTQLRRNSAVVARAQRARVQAMQEGLGGIRDVLLDQSQRAFVDVYERAEGGFRDARAANGFFAFAPRFLVEAAGMVMIAAIAAVVAQRPGGLTDAVPVLGALALGAQRLLPLLQQIYVGWASTAGNRQVLIDVVHLLRRRPLDAPSGTPREALPFAKAIRLENVGFAYSGNRTPALKGISLEIPKGARVGIVGRTGSGKSTLMDLVLGLLEPNEGKILVDGVKLNTANRTAWQKNIAHVPQAIYLADATIAENIAFGVPPQAIDHERVCRAAEEAELAGVIAALPDGYDTQIGERGVQLSGGQRQRIGIARALYKRANVFVFDEATSALDIDTETAVMAAIERLGRDLTILIIAHRLSTLQGCDLIVRLEEGCLKAIEKLPAIAPAEWNGPLTHSRLPH